MTIDEYKTGRQTNYEVEVNVEVNSVATSNDSTISNENYSPSPPPTQLFQLNKAKVKELNAFLMLKVNNTSGKKDSLLENVKEVIEDAEIFTVEYYS